MDISGGYIRSESPAPTPISSSTAPVDTPEASSTPTPASTAAEQAKPTASLENELTNVMAGLGSFWGKVRKQSVTAYQSAEKQMETARKDLTPLVSKARADLSSLAESSKAEFQRLSEAGSASGGVFIGADGMPIILDEPAPAKVDKGKGVDRSGAAEDESTSAAPAAKETEEGATPVADTVNPGAAAAAFFAKVQTQLASNPNVKGLSKNLATLQSSVQHLPASLQTNLTQLQTQFAHIDLNESQKAAEGYLHKGENWLAEFSTEVQRLALETVKVVPPGEDTEAGRALKRREERLRKAEQVAVGRRDALVHRLRTDPETLKVDPAQPIAPVVGGGSDGKEDKPVDTREAFSVFLQTVEDKGGFEGEEWAQQVKEELEVGGSGLEKTLKDLVPGTITSEAFWSRYFFRVAQIDEDEARRKRVLEGTTVAASDDEDFSWDMEDDDESTTSAAAPAPSSVPVAPSTPPPTTSSLPTDATAPDTPRQGTTAPSVPATSPRASSDGTSSYDVVGAASGTPSEHGAGEETVEEGKKEEKKTTAAPVTPVTKKEEEEEDEDSDWE